MRGCETPTRESTVNQVRLALHTIFEHYGCVRAYVSTRLEHAQIGAHTYYGSHSSTQPLGRGRLSGLGGGVDWSGIVVEKERGLSLRGGFRRSVSERLSQPKAPVLNTTEPRSRGSTTNGRKLSRNCLAFPVQRWECSRIRRIRIKERGTRT